MPLFLILFLSAVQAKSKIIMLKVLREFRGRNSTRPVSEEAKKLNGDKDKDVGIHYSYAIDSLFVTLLPILFGNVCLENMEYDILLYCM